MELSDVGKLGLSLALGLLDGLQRERAAPHVAGIRTIALVSVLGALVECIDDPLGAWRAVAAMASVALVLIVSACDTSTDGDRGPGSTTRRRPSWRKRRDPLHWKGPLHRFADRIGEADANAMFRLARLGLVLALG